MKPCPTKRVLFVLDREDFCDLVRPLVRLAGAKE
jgi:hypothetical protein